MAQTTSRLTYIGGSDIVALMGQESNDEYADWTSVWNRFRHQTHVELDSGQLDRGNAIEPYIEAYVRNHIDPTINSIENFERFDIENDFEDLRFDEEGDHLGNPFNVTLQDRAQIFAQDKLQPYLCGHVDGIGDEIVHEMKAPKMSNIDRLINYGYSKKYIIQAQFYMMITGRRLGMIHIWDYDNWEPIIIKIKRNEDLHEKMRWVTKRFWQALQDGDAECPDLHVQLKMGYVHNFDMEDLEQELSKLVEAREEKKRWTAIEKKLKPPIMAAVQDMWQPGEKKVQFTTATHKVTASESVRNGNPVVTLTVKENDIKQKVKTTN